MAHKTIFESGLLNIKYVEWDESTLEHHRSSDINSKEGFLEFSWNKSPLFFIDCNYEYTQTKEFSQLTNGLSKVFAALHHKIDNIEQNMMDKLRGLLTLDLNKTVYTGNPNRL